MINPISLYHKGMKIRQIVWYQGEADSGENDLMTQTAYECELNGLINGWREQFGIDNLPFIIIQLPAGGQSPYYDPPQDSNDEYQNWSAIQAAQYEVYKMNNNVGLVTCQDQGQGTLHYPYKQIVAKRAFQWMRYLSYDYQTVDVEAPKFDIAYKLNAADLNVYVNFSNVGSGIKLQPAINCSTFTPETIYTNTNHSYQCCEMNGVNIVRVKLDGIYWTDHQSHLSPNLWEWMPTNVTIINENTIMVTPLLPTTPYIYWPSNETKWVRTQTVSVRKMTIGNSRHCVLANSNGIPLASSQGPYDIHVVGDENQHKWQHKKTEL